MGSARVNFLRPAVRQWIVVDFDAVFDRSAAGHGDNGFHLVFPEIEFGEQDAIRCAVLALIDEILQPYRLAVKGVKVFFFRGLADSARYFTDTICGAGLAGNRPLCAPEENAACDQQGDRCLG